MARIILIEDNEQLRENARRILELEGHEVSVFGEGIAALEQIRDSPPELVLCDISLPGIDGHEVLRRVRELAFTTPVPFVFLTAMAERSEVRRGMEGGADDFLTKPFTSRELVSAVDARLDAAEKIRAINERDQAMRERQKLGHLPHEFRTPLNGILGGIALLRDDFAHLGAEFSETLALVEESSARLERTLLNYVLHTELAAGRFQPEIPARVNLAQLVSDSVREEAEKHGRLEDLRFELNDADGELPSQTIRTIVRELASNACKYSDAGSSIRISSGGGLAIIIEDSGRGMTEEEIRQIGPFRQFGRREWEQQGLGLGLAISQRLASASGLTLTIQARDGGGICAGLRLGDGSH